MTSSASSTFVALGHRNFRLLWLGQLISISGTMMQGVAILWHIALLAPPGWKALSLGLVGLARIGPILVFGLWSGVVADAVEDRSEASHQACLADFDAKYADVVTADDLVPRLRAGTWSRAAG